MVVCYTGTSSHQTPTGGVKSTRENTVRIIEPVSVIEEKYYRAECANCGAEHGFLIRADSVDAESISGVRDTKAGLSSVYSPAEMCESNACGCGSTKFEVFERLFREVKLPELIDPWRNGKSLSFRIDDTLGEFDIDCEFNGYDTVIKVAGFHYIVLPSEVRDRIESLCRSRYADVESGDYSDSIDDEDFDGEASLNEDGTWS